MNMNQIISLVFLQVEIVIWVLVGNFVKYNYYFVFDIVCQICKQFINVNMLWLGFCGGKVWDLVMGQVQYICCMF